MVDKLPFQAILMHKFDLTQRFELIGTNFAHLKIKLQTRNAGVLPGWLFLRRTVLA